MLENHGALLENHGALLENHGALLENHGALLEKHGAKLQKLQESVDLVDNRLSDLTRDLRDHGMLPDEGHEATG